MKSLSKLLLFSPNSGPLHISLGAHLQPIGIWYSTVWSIWGKELPLKVSCVLVHARCSDWQHGPPPYLEKGNYVSNSLMWSNGSSKYCCQGVNSPTSWRSKQSSSAQWPKTWTNSTTVPLCLPFLSILKSIFQAFLSDSAEPAAGAVIESEDEASDSSSDSQDEPTSPTTSKTSKAHGQASAAKQPNLPPKRGTHSQTAIERIQSVVRSRQHGCLNYGFCSLRSKAILPTWKRKLASPPFHRSLRWQARRSRTPNQ